MSAPDARPKPADPAGLADRPSLEHPPAEAVTAAVKAAEQHSAADAGRQLAIEAEILAELRRMNRLLYQITYGPRRYTLAFFSGITRGLGAVLGATVVFALFVGALSYLDTTPLIGNYVRQILMFVQQNGPVSTSHGRATATPSTGATPGATATATAIASPTAVETPAR